MCSSSSSQRFTVRQSSCPCSRARGPKLPSCCFQVYVSAFVLPPVFEFIGLFLHIGLLFLLSGLSHFRSPFHCESDQAPDLSKKSAAQCGTLRITKHRMRL